MSPRVRDFLWRTSKGLLPTKSAIVKRKVSEDPYCDVCGKEETTIHVLLQCPAAMKVWGAVPELKKGAKGVMNIMDWMARVMVMKDDNLKFFWAAAVYEIWFARNTRIFEGRCIEPDEIIEDAWATVEKCSTHGGVERAQQVADEDAHHHRWTLPEEGFVKLNCDASSGPKQGCGIGIMVRDANGGFLLG